jgi:uncharacterized protein with GYD domain
MPLYIFRAVYTAENIAAQIKNPQDRVATLRRFYEAQGGTFLGGGHPLGEASVVALVDLPDDVTATGHALSGFASGFASGGEVTRLISGEEWTDALRKAADVQYTPPGQ